MNRLNRANSAALQNPTPASLRQRRPLVLAVVEAVERRQLLSSVSGTVYSDVNANGSRQTGEAPLASEVVYADFNNNNNYDTGDVAVRTSASGVYKISNLPTNGSTLTIRVRGADGTRVVTPAGNGYAVKFTTSADLTGKDFAVKPATTTPPPATTVTVTGRAFYDRDFSGTYSSGDTTTSTVVFADLNANFQLDAGEPSATPAADGTFTITNAPASKTFNLVALGISGAGTGKGLTITTPAAGGTLGGVAIYSQPATTPTTATLTGRVTNDANGNGVADSSETGINSEVVYLDRNNNATYDTGDVAVRTDANGYYSIPNLTLDGSVVAIRLRSIVAPRTVTGVTAYVTNLTAAAAKASFNFTVASTTPQPTAATITGRINDDANQNGVADTGENGLANVLVYADANGNGIFDTNTEDYALTNAAGVYTLVTKPGTFTVRTYNPPLQGVDPDFTGRYPQFGGIPLVQTGPAANAGRAVSVAAGSTTTNVNFSAVNAAYARVTPVLANLGGENTFLFSGEVTGLTGPDLTYAWLDTNKNGVLDAGETVVAANRDLYEGQDEPSANPVYDLFLPRGSNQVDFGTSTAVGTKAIGSQIVSVTAATTTEIGPQVTIATTGSSVFGEIFTDANGNGVFDAGEEGYNSYLPQPPNFRVFADYNGNGVLDSNEPSAFSYSDGTITGGNGFYVLHGLDPTKSFTIRIDAASLPNGTVATNTPNLTVGVNQFVIGQNIGLMTASTAAITGRVADGSNKGVANLTAYADYNSNGVLDAGEPSAKTNSAGVYAFTTTLSSFYVNLVLAGSGYVQTSPVNGYGFGRYIDVTHLARKDNVNFVVTPPATITGTISLDANASGVADRGEKGVAGVTVYADYDGNGQRGNSEPTAVTNAAGVYSLSAGRTAATIRILEPLDYRVVSDQYNAGGGDTLYVQTGPGGINSGQTIDASGKTAIGGVNFSVVAAGYAIVAPQTTAADPDAKDLFGVGGPVYVWLDANKNGIRDANEPIVAKEYAPDGAGAPDYGYYATLLPAGVSSQIAFAASDAVGTKATTLYTTTVTANAASDHPVAITVPTSESGVFATVTTNDGYNGYIIQSVTVYADYNNNGVLDLGEPSTSPYGNPFNERPGYGYFYLPVDANRTSTLRAFGGYPDSTQPNPPVLTVPAKTTVTNVDLGYSL